MQVSDYSNISPEEARARITVLANRIFAEQFHQQFFIKHTDPYKHLQFEIAAFLDGRISEFHGWTDLLGQVTKPIKDAVESWIKWVKDEIFSKIWNTVSDWSKWLKDVLKGYIDSAIDWATSAYNKAVNIYDYITGTIKTVLDNAWSVLSNIATTIYNQAVKAVTIVKDWIADFYNKAKDVWDGITETVSGAFETLSKQVAALPQAIASAFQNAISYIRNALQGFWNDVIAPIGEKVKGAMDWMSEQITNLMSTAWDAILSALRSIAPVTPEKAEEAGISALKIAGLAGGGLLAMTAVWDLIHPFKDVIPGEVKAMLYDVTNFRLILGGLAGALVGAAIAQPAKYLYNSIFQPYIPREDDLKRFLWRGHITEEEYLNYLQYHGYSDKFRTAYLELTKQIPPPSDLTRFVVREVALMPDDYPTPQFFIDAMSKWGYDDYWARAYWWSHWELPAFGQLQEAYFRDIITREEFRKYIVWHDYSPDPRPGISKSDVDIMNELIFKMPDKLDARWMRRWGIITTEEHKRLLKYEGLHPDWLDRVALAEKMNMLSDERTEVKSALRSQYLIGIITQQVLQAKLREIYYTPEETEMLLRAAEERYRTELTKDAIDAAKYSYRLGYTTKEQLAEQLINLGISDEKVQKIVAIETARAVETRREALQESIYIYGRDTVIKRFREGLTTDRELEEELRMIGYQDRQIPHFRTIAYLERDYDFAMTVLSTVKRAYKKKKIDDSRFIELLRSFGFTDDKISLELSLLKLELGLGLEGEEVAG